MTYNSKHGREFLSPTTRADTTEFIAKSSNKAPAKVEKVSPEGRVVGKEQWVL